MPKKETLSSEQTLFYGWLNSAYQYSKFVMKLQKKFRCSVCHKSISNVHYIIFLQLIQISVFNVHHYLIHTTTNIMKMRNISLLLHGYVMLEYFITRLSRLSEFRMLSHNTIAPFCTLPKGMNFMGMQAECVLLYAKCIKQYRHSSNSMPQENWL